ncbi:vitamin K epoxide reductase family protein [Aquimarina algiphila]|uniref:vitamin K epoxide reductase family protein n=1 Tax=Aquimarina algiphila TaxID=2047982 RepID=UPI00249369B5|nr:vitamin K epoxide reductase family protein [Aquimarina algiphila]
MPNKFVTFLSSNLERNYLHYVERKDDFFYVDGQKTSISDLNKRWKGIVLSIEGNTLKHKHTSIIKSQHLLIFLGFLVFVSSLYGTYNYSWNNLFFLFPLLGFILSLNALKDLFKLDHVIFSKFCNATSNSNCDSVIKSDKWMILKKVNFSDLSIIFFSSQFISFMIMGLVSLQGEYFSYQKITLFFSFPLIFISIYFQTFIVKKWCPICISIIMLLILEYIFISFFIKEKISINFNSAYLFLFIHLIVFIVWKYFKKTITQINNLKESKIKSIRFLRNYSLFKKVILQKDKYEFPNNLIINNTQKKTLTLTLITNPQCKHCRKAHFIIKKLIKKYEHKISLSIIFNVDIQDEFEDDKIICQHLVTIQKNNHEKFQKALDDWFEEQNISKWLDKYSSEINMNKANKTLVEQNNWCSQNQINFTPALFLNKYLYSTIYDIENLDFFLQDIIHDSDFIL